MVTLCKQCTRANPAEATYCYFDGVSLRGSHVDGPVDVAQAPFPEPFYFPSGECCENFDQLALACQAHWSETWALLQSGQLKGLLARLGRIDLIHAAAEAVADSNPDHGVDFFLSRLPANNLTPPRLRVEPAQHDLGTLPCGLDLWFDVRLLNDGHRQIVGHLRSDCAWLDVEGATADRPRLLQFVDEQHIRVRVVGTQLPASLRPREGKLLVRTNAGDAEVPVCCMVPVVPFPEGVLRGCDTPRELAKRARRALQEAAPLFTAGAVQAWYRANGWTYPVEGSPATGKAAVQQFFEALGLTTPPCVVLDTTSLFIVGPAGSHVRRTVRVHSDDPRPIFAFGRSLSPWLSVVDCDTRGNVAHVTVEANVPASSLGRLETQLEVRANGNQRFHVPVVLTILPDAAAEVVPNAAPHIRAVPHSAGSGRMRALVAASVLGWICFFAMAATILFMMSASPQDTPLKPYAAAISDRTCAALEVDFRALQGLPGFENDMSRLHANVGPWLQDLGLTPGDVRLRRLFVAVSLGDRPLTVWTFDARVQLGKVANERYRIDDANLRIDLLNPTLAWAVDGQGRLLRGTPDDVRAALERERNRQTSGAYELLAQAVAGIAPDTIAWAAGDLRNGGAAALPALLGEDGVPAISRFHLALANEPSKGFVLRGRGAFATPADAALCRDWLRSLPSGPNSLVAALDFKHTLDGADWEPRGVELHLTASLPPERTHSALALALGKLEQSRQAKQTIADQKQYEVWLNSARDALGLGKVPEARSTVDKLKKFTFDDPQRDALEKDLVTAERRLQLDFEFQRVRAFVKPEQIARLREHFQRARDIDPANEYVKLGIAAAMQLQESDDALGRAKKQLAQKLPGMAHEIAMQTLSPLLRDAGSSVWREEPFKTHRARLLRECALICKQAFDDHTAAADAAKFKAEQELEGQRLADAAAAYDEATASLQRAKTILNDLRDLDDKSNPALPTAKQLDAQIDSLMQAAMKARSQNLVAEGSAILKDAREKLATAPANPAGVPNILTRLQRALKLFDKAEQLQNGAASTLVREAEKLQTQFDRVLHPIHLDLRTGLIEEDWPTYRKTAWRVELLAGGWSLHFAQAKPLSLTSADRPWPVEFVLRMDFALLDARKTIDNRLWAQHSEPLQLALIGSDGSKTTIALGGKTIVEWKAKLRVNQKKQDINTDNDLYDKNDKKIRLVLKCSKPDAAGKMLVRVAIKDTLIDTVTIASDIVAVQLRIANPSGDGKTASAFVAIFRLDVSWSGADAVAAPLR